jgi:hypothetical protein
MQSAVSSTKPSWTFAIYCSLPCMPDVADGTASTQVVMVLIIRLPPPNLDVDPRLPWTWSMELARTHMTMIHRQQCVASRSGVKLQLVQKTTAIHPAGFFMCSITSTFVKLTLSCRKSAVMSLLHTSWALLGGSAVTAKSCSCYLVVALNFCAWNTFLIYLIFPIFNCHFLWGVSI